MATKELSLEITELHLGLPGTVSPAKKNHKKRVFSDESEKKKQVVGWPPICCYRKKKRLNEESEKRKIYVKVSMDGAPFLRKMDLGINNGYSELAMEMEKLFGCSVIGFSDYVPIYEDRDGDWMLLGDVPWKMFTESCKRLRIMKRSEAKGFEICPTPQTSGSSKSL